MKERTQEWWIEVSIRRAFRDWIERQEGVECKPEPASKAFQARAEKRYRLWLEQERERDQFERSQALMCETDGNGNGVILLERPDGKLVRALVRTR